MPRIFADWLSRKWGQAVIIDDRTGAGGNIGAEFVAKSDPDGYTLLASPPPPLVINQNLYPHLDYDARDFVPMAIMSRVPNALVVNPDKIAANTVQEFIAYALANPGKVTDATQGNGTTSHLTSELFQMMAHVKLQNVPYRGSAPALNDLVAGSVDCMFDNLGVSLPLVKAGKLKLIAVAAPKRMASLPGTPTIAETLPGFEAAAWYAFVGPRAYAGRGRREGQCRHQRSAARSRNSKTPCRSLCRAGRRQPAGDGDLFPRGDRALEERDHLGACDAGLIQFKNPVEIHGTAATTIVPMTSAIM